MAVVRAQAERTIPVEAGRLYDLISDYSTHRPHYLPPAYSNYRVEEGGKGAGTVVGWTLDLGRRTRTPRLKIDEPRPGSVLTESELASSLVTTWTVTPQGSGSRVTIATQWQGASGIGGFFERTFAPGALKRLYDEQLASLEAYAARGTA